MMEIKDVRELEYYLKIKENVFLFSCNIIRTGKICTSNKPNNNEIYNIINPKKTRESIENDCNLL